MYLLPDNNKFFPHPLTADSEGILAFGYSLDKESILNAYRFGIFPWYNDTPIVWWYTHPRCVLFPDDLKIHKSMRPYLNQKRYRHTFNQDFAAVIKECQNTKRIGQEGTWITDELIACFIELHHEGFAHSVEVWDDDKLVGGLYGMKLGHIFFGESMFHKAPNASKYGFIQLVQQMKKEGIFLIDCQQQTSHLMSLGATVISKTDFWKHIKQNWIHELQSPQNQFPLSAIDEP